MSLLCLYSTNIFTNFFFFFYYFNSGIPAHIIILLLLTCECNNHELKACVVGVLTWWSLSL